LLDRFGHARRMFAANKDCLHVLIAGKKWERLSDHFIGLRLRIYCQSRHNLRQTHNFEGQLVSRTHTDGSPGWRRHWWIR